MRIKKYLALNKKGFQWRGFIVTDRFFFTACTPPLAPESFHLTSQYIFFLQKCYSWLVFDESTFSSHFFPTLLNFREWLYFSKCKGDNLLLKVTNFASFPIVVRPEQNTKSIFPTLWKKHLIWTECQIIIGN